jgi:MFS family permease
LIAASSGDGGSLPARINSTIASIDCGINEGLSMTSSNTRASTSRLRFRIGALAFLSFNLAMACMWGTFGVLLTAIEAKMGVGREVSSLAASVVMVSVALSAPVAGILSSKFSLRLLLMVGSLLGSAGYILLALASNIQVTLLAYGLLVGPSLCLCGVVGPGTLVTRWFAAGRGRALGLVHIPIVVALMPLLATFVLHQQGLSTVYIMLAVLMGLNLIAQAFVVDHPAIMPQTSGEAISAAPVDPGLTTGQLFFRLRFWSMAVAFSSNIGGTMLLSAHLVPMATGWGNDPARAASLLTLMSLAGMLGPLTFGWLADKLGGRLTLTILCFDSAVLWAVLLSKPPFPVLALVIALFGLHSSGSIPAFAMSLSEYFGQSSFARAYGLGNMVTLPFTVLMIPLAAIMFVHTGSYGSALLVQACFFLVAALFVLAIGGPRTPVKPAVAVSEPAT